MSGSRFRRLFSAVTTFALVGCSDAGDAATTDPADTSATVTTTADPIPATATQPPEPLEVGRVVALGEVFLLADLLALGLAPVASTATVPDAGFQGLDQFDTTGIEILPATELNLEQLAALQPDLIVSTQFVADEAALQQLTALAELLVLPDDATAEQRLRLLADRFDATTTADELIGALETARRDLRAAVSERDEPCVVSVATIYPGPSVAAWIDGSTDIPRTILDAGCRIVPSAILDDVSRAASVDGEIDCMCDMVALRGGAAGWASAPSPTFAAS